MFPKYTRIIYGLTILIFGYWNSSISQGLINFLNNSAIHVGRTVDPTDFLAFSVMPFSFIYFKSQIARLRRRIIIPTGTVIGAVAVFSFVATTLPKQSAELGIGSNKTYTLELDKTEFFGKLQPGYLLSDTIELNLVDSLFYLYYYVPDIRADMFVLANITEQDDKTIIRLDNFLTGSVTGSLFSGVDEDDLRAVEKVNKSEHEEFFQKYFIGQLLKPTNESRGLYYNNKNIYDEIQRRYE
ncbi:hypothetical protein MB14_06840 [Roseivirga ehrenbergii]|uniref:Uncharacterized protein n=1 Tax=Roseivirga ehrenbergii (strain DSM 102268 / JCM 13514 / KCTC 12282 / NCIMB 14502 / KMM 6017) TaxID=279360 RepID=A0A150X891_ROSEK|nr:hypothetical protein MB14_06840 [Roseivirga ehrenbergii]